jgi:hypothetical protein
MANPPMPRAKIARLGFLTRKVVSTAMSGTILLNREQR